MQRDENPGREDGRERDSQISDIILYNFASIPPKNRLNRIQNMSMTLKLIESLFTENSRKAISTQKKIHRTETHCDTAVR